MNQILNLSTGLPLWVDVLAALLLVTGGAFALVGAIGLVRLPDFFTRLHAPTKASTLGVGGVLLASIVLGWAQQRPALHELLITLFLFVTAPVSANLLVQAALQRRCETLAALPPEPPLPEGQASAAGAEADAATPAARKA